MGTTATMTKDGAAPAKGPGFADPKVGDRLLTAAGIAFLFLCMMLPLVGPAASHGSGSPGATTAPYYGANFATFLVMNLLTLGLAVAAVLSKLATRRAQGGRFPLVSVGLAAGCAFTLFALFAGLFKI